MIWQWIGLTAFSVALLPARLAIPVGWAPARLRHRLAPVHLRGWAVLAVSTAAPLNAVPRLASASELVTLALTAAAAILAVTGCLLAAFSLGKVEGTA